MAEMGGVRLVHGGDVGRDRRAQVIVVIGGDADAAGALDQERGVADEGDADLVPAKRRWDDRQIAPGDESRACLGRLRRRRKRQRQDGRKRRPASENHRLHRRLADMSRPSSRSGFARAIAQRFTMT
jgi:hypothetical protein